MGNQSFLKAKYAIPEYIGSLAAGRVLWPSSETRSVGESKRALKHTTGNVQINDIQSNTESKQSILIIKERRRAL